MRLEVAGWALLLELGEVLTCCRGIKGESRAKGRLLLSYSAEEPTRPGSERIGKRERVRRAQRSALSEDEGLLFVVFACFCFSLRPRCTRTRMAPTRPPKPPATKAKFVDEGLGENPFSSKSSSAKKPPARKQNIVKSGNAGSSKPPPAPLAPGEVAPPPPLFREAVSPFFKQRAELTTPMHSNRLQNTSQSTH